MVGSLGKEVLLGLGFCRSRAVHVVLVRNWRTFFLRAASNYEGVAAAYPLTGQPQLTINGLLGTGFSPGYPESDYPYLIRCRNEFMKVTSAG